MEHRADDQPVESDHREIGVARSEGDHHLRPSHLVGLVSGAVLFAVGLLAGSNVRLDIDSVVESTGEFGGVAFSAGLAWMVMLLGAGIVAAALHDHSRRIPALVPRLAR